MGAGTTVESMPTFDGLHSAGGVHRALDNDNSAHGLSAVLAALLAAAYLLAAA